MVVVVVVAAAVVVVVVAVMVRGKKTKQKKRKRRSPLPLSRPVASLPVPFSPPHTQTLTLFSLSSAPFDPTTHQQGLYEQFRRVANLYFLLIAALSLTPVSPVSPVTNIVPLVLVIAASLAKEAFTSRHDCSVSGCHICAGSPFFSRSDSGNVGVNKITGSEEETSRIERAMPTAFIWSSSAFFESSG